MRPLQESQEETPTLHQWVIEFLSRWSYVFLKFHYIIVLLNLKLKIAVAETKIHNLACSGSGFDPWQGVLFPTQHREEFG